MMEQGFGVNKAGEEKKPDESEQVDRDALPYLNVLMLHSMASCSRLTHNGLKQWTLLTSTGQHLGCLVEKATLIFINMYNSQQKMMQ